MLQVFIVIQYLGIIQIFIQLMILLLYRPSYLQRMLLIMEVATLVNHVGCLFVLQAENADEALMGVKFSYLGKPFITFAIFLFLLQFYRVQIPMVLKYGLSVFHVFVTLTVLSCERHTLFYSGMEYLQSGYFPHLQFAHGPVYRLNTLLLLIYCTLGIVFSIVKRKEMHTKNERRCANCLNLIILMGAGGLLIYLTGKTGGYDTTLPAFLLGNLLLHMCTIRYNMLDAVDVAKDTIVDEIAQGILVVGFQGRLIYKNRQLDQIFAEENMQDIDLIYKEIKRYHELGERFSIGSHIYEIKKKILVKRGIGYGKMFVLNDVTENHNHAIELERQMVIAEMANSAKSDFLARMSHEIRTPINAIVGMNEMILREEKNHMIEKYARNIKSSTNTLLSLINDILDTSKIESGKLEIIPMEYELDSLLNDVVNAIYLKAKEKGLKLEIQVDEKLPNCLYGDDVRIRQILINLLNNAVKYTNEGSITFLAEDRSTENETILYFEVSDTGIGIKEEDLPRLCEAFERIETTRNRNVEGTGLGMSIVSDLLHLMGSQIHVESKYGEGSCFSFELVQECRSGEKIGDYESRIKNLSVTEEYHCLFRAPDARILLVDDNDINRDVFCNLLKQTQVQIVDVNSGARCIEEAFLKHYDLIFLDHMMPGMDGIETLHCLKEMTDCPCADTPVVALTANAVTGAKEKYMEAGFHAYLSKPIVSAKLERLMMELLPKELLFEPFEEPEEFEDESGRIEDEQLPEISGINWDFAHVYNTNNQILWATVKSVYRSLELERSLLTELFTNVYNNIDREQNLSEYRIRVHALKSNCASIGALMVSQLARLLEQKAIAQDLDAIQKLHPFLLEELQQLHTELTNCTHIPEKENAAFDTEKMSDESWNTHMLQLLEQLETALRENDYDEADLLTEQIAAFAKRDIDADIAEQIQAIQDQEFALNFDACIGTIVQLMKRIGIVQK